jgi:DNA-directed RNA polymerase specialized sigma24 family protein
MSDIFLQNYDYARRRASWKASQLIGTGAFKRGDREDLLQDLLLDCWQRRSKYDACRSSPRTFFSRLVDHKGADLQAAARTQKRRVDQLTLSLDDTRKTGIPPAETNSALTSIDETQIVEFGIDITRVLAMLPTEYAILARSLAECSTVAKAAHKLGISRSSAYRRIRYIRVVFRLRGLDRYLSDVPRRPMRPGVEVRPGRVA